MSNAFAVETDRQARAILQHAQGEEFKHFGINLEFLLRRKAKWRGILKDILFQEGDIVRHGEEAERENGEPEPILAGPCGNYHG